MNAIEALAECVKRPGEVAARKAGAFGHDNAVMFANPRWYGLSTGHYGKPQWSTMALCLYPDEFINPDGTPVEWEVVPVADVEAGR